MTKQEYTNFKKQIDANNKILEANNVLIKKHAVLANNHLKAAIELSKIIDNHVKKVTQPKPAKRLPKVSLVVRLHALRSIKNNQN